MILLPKYLAYLTHLAGKESRFAMGAMKIIVGEDYYRLEVTDGHCLGIVRGPTEPDGVKPPPGMPMPGDLECEADEGLIPAGEMSRAWKQTGKAGVLGVHLTPSGALLFGEGVRYAVTMSEGRFPDVDVVLPKGPAPVSIKVNAYLLMDVLNIAAEVATKGSSKASPTVTLLFWPGVETPGGVIGVPMGVTALNDDGVTFDGLVMPMDPPALDPCRPDSFRGP